MIMCLLALRVVLLVLMHGHQVRSVIAMQILSTGKPPDDAMQTICGIATLIVLLHAIAACVIAAQVRLQKPRS